ncbi:hypothetical protein [Pedobacter alpinus]|uniref:FlgN protein n=1 Tax=Pedobacter alpinus TaxID=1590643 RepID=A0ABW5TU90_9SPHI
METTEQKQLSAELQELYLENKEWFSEILFLEDEMRFFRKLFDKVITLSVQENKIGELHPVNKSLTELNEKRQALKTLIIKHQHDLESLIKDELKTNGIDLLNDNAQIIKTIKALFAEEKVVRKNLYVLTEKVFEDEHKGHLLSN